MLKKKKKTQERILDAKAEANLRSHPCSSCSRNHEGWLLPEKTASTLPVLSLSRRVA